MHIFSLSRYKLKFSPDKVDTMIVQAICKYYLKYLKYLTVGFEGKKLIYLNITLFQK